MARDYFYLVRNAKPFEDMRTCAYEIQHERPRRLDKDGWWTPVPVEMGEIDAKQCPIKLKRGEGPVKVKLAVVPKKPSRAISKERVLFLTRNQRPYAGKVSGAYDLWSKRSPKLRENGFWGPTADFLGQITEAQAPVDLEPGDGPIRVMLVAAEKQRTGKKQ